MNTIVINGKSYATKGKNITITVNDEVIEEGVYEKLEIKFFGDLGNLTSHNAVISGVVFGNVEAHNVQCGDIKGDVNAHNVTCNEIKGNIDAKNVKRK